MPRKNVCCEFCLQRYTPNSSIQRFCSKKCWQSSLVGKVNICSEGYQYFSGRYEHPISQKNGLLYLHREVLFKKIGPGSHSCFHCEVIVTWMLDLEVDHLDYDKLNNDP